MVKLVKSFSLLISTTFNHYLNGPPRPSWDLKYHLAWAMLKLMFRNVRATTIEQMQRDSFRIHTTVPADVVINEFKINDKYRCEAQVHLENILKPYEHVLDTDWKDLNEDGLVAEWVQVFNDRWEKREIRKTILYLHGGAYYLCNKDSYRFFTPSFAKKTNARILGTN
jgi:acetyl esterase/lipase